MIRRIAFIHTVAMLVERFRPRLQAELPEADCFHMLDESVLQDLIRQGPSSAITRRVCGLARLAEDAGADLIVFTCSSTSPAIDVARDIVTVPILKIDDPMYAEAARTPCHPGERGDEAHDHQQRQRHLERAARGAAVRRRVGRREESRIRHADGPSGSTSACGCVRPGSPRR